MNTIADVPRACDGGRHGETGWQGRRMTAHVRIGGVLRRMERGMILETEGGAIWRLAVAADLVVPADGPVIIEGRTLAADQVEAIWIGQPS